VTVINPGEELPDPFAELRSQLEAVTKENLELKELGDNLPGYLHEIVRSDNDRLRAENVALKDKVDKARIGTCLNCDSPVELCNSKAMDLYRENEKLKSLVSIIERDFHERGEIIQRLRDLVQKADSIITTQEDHEHWLEAKREAGLTELSADEKTGG